MNRIASLVWSLIVIIAVTNFIAVFAVSYIFNIWSLPFTLKLTLVIAASLITATVTTAFIVIWSPLVKTWLATVRRFSRLDNLHHPLLVRLNQIAPGTYQHSLVVSQLAAQAASAIGADELRARVGGLYHDIGKMEKPAVFTENQPNKTRVPKNWRITAASIREHVPLGINLGRRNNLPGEIIDFIPQHHGTTIAENLYNQVKKIGGKQIQIDDFRYPGPKPLAKETAIVMLADGTEAIARTRAPLSPQLISQLVEQVIKDKINQRQLELSGLSRREIGQIKKSFTATLTSIYHRRRSK